MERTGSQEESLNIRAGANDAATAVLRAKPKDAMDGDAPHAISGWNGSSYSTKTVTTVVYNNKEEPTSVAFSKRWAEADAADAAQRNGTYTFEAGANGKYVSMPNLPTHASHTGVTIGPDNGVRGTFNGVAGVFTSGQDNRDPVVVGINVKGVPTWTGMLNFEPDSGASMVMQEDTSFLNLGWWLTEANGDPSDVQVAAWAEEGYDATTDDRLNKLIGKATFEGIAVGKYTHKTINSINGGHFNADATLVMDFSAPSDADPGTLRGTIDNFMQDGESIGDGWKVELGGAAASNTPDGFDPEVGGTIATAGTVEAAADSAMGTFGNQKTLGTWNAMLVDNTRNDGMPGGVTGQFHIGEASHPINMVGAFAASNMEADQPKK